MVRVGVVSGLEIDELNPARYRYTSGLLVADNERKSMLCRRAEWCSPANRWVNRDPRGKEKL